MGGGGGAPPQEPYYGATHQKSTGRQVHFLNLTGDTEPSEMRQEGQKHNNRRHGHFLKPTCDMATNK